jgi:16S rRNA G1207 methylase RsmC
VVFSDINEKALENTRDNLRNNGINKNISVVYSDLFENIPQKFDCIFANLPISNDVFKLGEKTENIALRFLNESKKHANSNGKIYFAR